MTPPSETSTVFETPGLRRRLACFVYEGLMLFGVVMGAGLLWSVLTEQRHALVGLHGLQAFVFIVLGAYFIWFWTRRGQTLPMQTWHIRLLTQAGQPVSRGRALCRYLAAWVWFMPALLLLWLTGLGSGAGSAAAVLLGVLGYAALSNLHPARQYWHDALCGTQLVVWRHRPNQAMPADPPNPPVS